MNFELIHDVAIAFSLAAINISIISWFAIYLAISALMIEISFHIYHKILRFFHRG